MSDAGLPIIKFTRRRHARAMVDDGELLLRSLAYFAYEEVVRGEPGVGDETESASILTITRYDSAEGDPLGLISEGTPRPGMRLIMEGAVQYHTAPPALIFCASRGEVDRLSPSFREWCDAAVEIIDPEGLSKAIVEEGQTKRGAPVSTLLKAGEHRKVEYRAKKRDFAEGVAPATGPFVKPHEFCAQREYRFHFPAQDQFLTDQLIIRVPRPERFFRLAPTNLPEIATQPANRADRDLTVEVLALQKKLDALTEAEWARRAAPYALDGRYDDAVLELLWEVRLQLGVRLCSNLAYRPGNNNGLFGILARALESGQIGTPVIQCTGFEPMHNH